MDKKKLIAALQAMRGNLDPKDGIAVNSLKLDLTEEVKQSLQTSFNLATPEDLANFMTPKDGDFVMVPVRMLSANDKVQGIFNFAHNDGQALREAVDLFSNVPVFKDHIFSVDEAVGRMQTAFWDAGTQGAPAGVSNVMKLDAVVDPKLARNFVTGTLDSVSVTVAFDWEPSHPNMKESEFFSKLGEVVDGRMVQPLVTKITRVYEMSVVWQGADKYAKTIGDDGAIHVPGTSNSLSEIPPTHKEATVDPKKLAALLGLTLENPTEETLTAALAGKTLADSNVQEQLATATAQVTELTATLTAKTTEVTTLTAQVAELKPQAELGTKFLADTRAEALRLYNLCEGEKASDVMRATINEANLELAKSFISSYKDRAEQLAPLTCTSCGSHQVNRKSSNSDGHSAPEPVSTEKLKAERLKANVASIHGN